MTNPYYYLKGMAAAPTNLSHMSYFIKLTEETWKAMDPLEAMGYPKLCNQKEWSGSPNIQFHT